MSSIAQSLGYDKSGVFSGLTAAEAIAGIVAIVLTILALAHVAPNFLVAIATVAIGVALLAQGSGVAGEYARLTTYQAEPTTFGGSSTWSIELLAGAAGVVLGILALPGVAPIILVASAIIAMGGGLSLSAGATAQIAFVNAMRGSSNDHVRRFTMESASTSSITQGLSGLQAIVLGILSLAGFSSISLVLIALLAVGVFLLVNGSAFGGFVLSFFHH